MPASPFNHPGAGGKPDMPFTSQTKGSARVLSVLFALSAFPALAQDPTPPAASADTVKYGWTHQVNGMLNLTQAYYDNWSKGGNDALAYEVNLGGQCVNEQPKYQWLTKSKAVYGRTKTGNLASRKSSDELNLESIYTYKMSVMVNPFASVTGQTQFMPGYDYPGDTAKVLKSDSFDPTYITETVGLGVTPFKGLKERLGGTMKQTISSELIGIADDKETLDEVETFKQEYGVTSITEYEAQLMENIKGTTRYEVFANFESWHEVDQRWTNQITAKVNAYISVNFEYEMLKDWDLSHGWQTREGLNVGISFLQL
jgi:hypothetical protein